METPDNMEIHTDIHNLQKKVFSYLVFKTVSSQVSSLEKFFLNQAD